MWDGTETEFTDLTTQLNQNEYGIQLSGNISPGTMEYLDTELKSEDNKMISITYFKEVDTNSLLDFKSVHYKQWLSNVPFGQFRRLRKNCTLEKDFEEQSHTMTKKKCPKHLIHEAKTKAGNLSQETCLLPSKKPKKQLLQATSDYQHNFITTYNHAYSNIVNILSSLNI